MTRVTKLDIIDYLVSSPSQDFDLPLDLLNPTFPSLDIFSPLENFLTVTDVLQIHRTTTPFCITSSRNPITRRRLLLRSSDLYLQSLSDRVSALELAFDLVNNNEQDKKSAKSSMDRKYTWTAEINSSEKNGVDRKYKVTTEIKGGKKKEKSSKWTAEIKKKGDDVRKYTFTASTAADEGESDKKKKMKEKKKEKSPRIVEIQGEPVRDHDHGALLLKQAFDRALERNKGKKKELSPQDAAMVIQMTFRAYLIKRSQTLRALRELAVAKGRLKELRSLFNNFSYRRRLAHNAEEKQKFSEKVIVLLITVDAIEGADIMVRAAKRSMVDELEAMLDVVDPQPGGGPSASLKRRTFDMPDAVIQKELADGVAQVVRMLGQDNGSETFEACV